MVYLPKKPGEFEQLFPLIHEIIYKLQFSIKMNDGLILFHSTVVSSFHIIRNSQQNEL